jgi:hypothetical protein
MLCLVSTKPIVRYKRCTGAALQAPGDLQCLCQGGPQRPLREWAETIDWVLGEARERKAPLRLKIDVVDFRRL